MHAKLAYIPFISPVVEAFKPPLQLQQTLLMSIKAPVMAAWYCLCSSYNLSQQHEAAIRHSLPE